MAFNSHRSSFYASLCKDRSLTRDVLTNLFGPQRWHSTKLLGAGSHALVVFNKFVSKDSVYKISLGNHGCDTEYEGLVGTWLSSCEGPVYPPRPEDGRKFLNVTPIRRVSRVDLEDARKICATLRKMVRFCWQNANEATLRALDSLLSECETDLKKADAGSCAGFVQEMEKFPLDARKWICSSLNEEGIVFRAKSCLLQILKTYEHLRKRLSLIHGDLRLDNVLLKMGNLRKIEYPGENKNHVLEGNKDLCVCSISDFGFSHMDATSFLKDMGFRSKRDWNPDFSHEIDYDTDLHLLGLTTASAVATALRRIGGEDAEGKVLEILKFCAELLFPAKRLGPTGTETVSCTNMVVDFTKEIETLKRTIGKAKTAEEACAKFMEVTSDGHVLWKNILYIPIKALKRRVRIVRKKYSEHEIFRVYETRKRKRQ